MSPRRRERTQRAHITVIVAAVLFALLPLIRHLTSFVREARRERVPIDLGYALYPEDLPLTMAVPRIWEVPPRNHRLSYGLGVREETDIVISYGLFKDRMGARREGDGYRHNAPPQCREDLRCVYDELVKLDAAAILPIARRFLIHAKANSLQVPELAQLIVAYVQSIQYRTVGEDPYGLVPPAILVNSSGDCDSKSLLAAMLLRSVGIEAVLLVSNSARHAMLGLGLPVGRDRFDYSGRSFAVVEITQPRWPIGRMPPTYASHRDWRVVPVGFQ